MTVHSAKGLEFDTVFVVGMEENIFPSQRSLTSLRELEEERRLLYVAITRAKHHCFLTHAEMRYRYGQSEYNRPSRFLKEIDKEWLRGDNRSQRLASASHTDLQFQALEAWERGRPRPHLKPISFRGSSSPSGETEGGIGHFPVGTIVSHNTFGRGTVVNCEGYADDLKVTVRFDNVGTKTLLAKFARLQIVEK